MYNLKRPLSEARKSPVVVLVKNLRSLIWLCYDVCVVSSHIYYNWNKLCNLQKIREDFCDMIYSWYRRRFLPWLIFSGEATFHLNGDISYHNFCIWERENPQEIVQQKQDSQKLNDFFAISFIKMYGLFERNTKSWHFYLELLQDWLNDGSEGFIFQQVGTYHIRTTEFVDF